MIQEKIQQDIVDALKAGRHDDTQILRGVMAEIKNKEIDEKRTLNDTEVVIMMQKMVKKIEEANEQFLTGGRDDLAEENMHEITILKQYLPAELSDEEVEKKVRDVVAKHPGIERGPLTGIAIKELTGAVESSRVAKAINTILAEKS